jgi:HlyD family secretion protein
LNLPEAPWHGRCFVSVMDRPRTDQVRRRGKRWIIASAITLELMGVTVAVTRLTPAAATVERSLVWIDTVKRGEMLREARGIGTLVPEQISWIAARSAGRVDRIVLYRAPSLSRTM